MDRSTCSPLCPSGFFIAAVAIALRKLTGELLSKIIAEVETSNRRV
jgi:hypothetical protein